MHCKIMQYERFLYNQDEVEEHLNDEAAFTKQPMNHLLQILLQNHGGEHLEFLMTKNLCKMDVGK